MAATELLDHVGIVLLGGRWAGKSSSGNTILGLQGPESFGVGKQTAVCVGKERSVCGARVTVIDTPSWNWVPAEDTAEEVRVQLKGSATLTEGGAPAFLLVFPLGSPFAGRHRVAVEQHLELLGPGVWERTAVLFSRGDWLTGRGTTIEEHLRGASEELRWLLDACGQRYHVLNNKDAGDRAQVSELLRTVRGMLGGGGGERRAPETEDTLSRREEVLEKREHVVAKTEGMIRSWEEVIGKREKIVREREEMVEKREETVREREELVEKREEILRKQRISGTRKRKQSLDEPLHMPGEKPGPKDGTSSRT